MKAICVIRLAGCVLGLFAVATGAADIFGFVPYSSEMPPWSTRLISQLPVVFGGIFLLTPIRLFLTGMRYQFLALAYLLLTLALAAKCVKGITEFIAGGKHFLIIPTGLAFFFIPAANAFVLWCRRQESTQVPMDKAKPNPSDQLA